MDRATADMPSRDKRIMHPLAGLAAVACCLALYPAASAGESIHLTGLVDNFAYALAFLALGMAVLAIRKPRLRISAMLLIIGFNIFFFWGNLLYYRFFNVSVGYDIFKQWKDAAPIASAVFALMKWPDFIFMLAVPLSLSWVLLNSVHGGKRGLSSAMLLASLSIIILHSLIWGNARGFSKSNPLIGLPRQAASILWLEYFTSREFERISSHISRYFPLNGSLYKYADETQYPLLKKPIAEPGDNPEKMPNVVFVLLESVRAFESGFYNRYSAGYTPNLDRLARKGLAFRNFYANSSGTVNGEFASLSSFYTSAGGETLYNKFPALGIRTLPSILRDRGYSTAWISGFSSGYGNKGSFWRSHGVEEIHDNIPEPYLKLGWGPSDNDIFNHALSVMESMPEPFYAEILTLSNHFEFDWDYPTRDETPPAIGGKLYRDYTGGVYYTDYALGRFIAAARERDFFDNSIFVITGDHGVALFPDSDAIDRIRVREIASRVPFILYAPGIIKPSVNSRPASQVDIAPTVLDLLGIREANSFAGSSLLREEAESSHVFMKYVSIWSLRVGNDYCYEIGNISKSIREEFMETRAALDPMNPDRKTVAESLGSIRKALQGSDDYACFSTARDLLLPYKASDLRPLSKVRRKELMSLGNDLNYFSSYILIKDRIYPATASDPAGSR
jgi:phosphoglycerol transferase MdoB-like AlkP superfamily enzyme